MMIRKKFGLLLAAAMLLGSLAACAPTGPDPVQEVLGYRGDTTFFTVNGEKVSAQDYLLWLTQEIEYINSYYLSAGYESVDWEEDMGGITAKEYLKEQARETAKLVAVMRQTAESKGFRYDSADSSAYAQEREAVIESQGGQEAYDRFLLEMCMTDESMERVNRSNVLYRKMLEGLFTGSGQNAPSDASIEEELAARNVLRAKHILLLTSEANLDAQPYSDIKIAEQRELAEQILDTLRSSGNPQETFDALMHEHSEDTGLASNPDGYVFSTEPDGNLFTGRMVTSFEEGTMALGIGEISGIVESEYGLHIILRLDPREDETFMERFLSTWAGERLDQMLQDAMNSAELTTTDAFDQLDAQAFYEALLAYRDRLGGGDGQEDALPEEETPLGEGGSGDGTPEEGNSPEEGE